MNETLWNQINDPAELMRYLHMPLSVQEIRQYVTTCCRSWNWLSPEWQERVTWLERCNADDGLWSQAEAAHERHFQEYPPVQAENKYLESCLHMLFSTACSRYLTPRTLGVIVQYLRDVVFSEARSRQPNLRDSEARDQGLYESLATQLRAFVGNRFAI